MKNQFLKAAAILFIGLSVVACKDAKNKTEANEAEEVVATTDAASKFTADVDNSTIAWKGTKLTGAHNGTIKITDGQLSTKNDKLIAGNFVIDMNAITVLDITKAEDNAKLLGHLNSGDFFEVEKFGKSTFELTGVEEKDGKTVVKGNLTMKDITKNIEFPATIVIDGNTVSLKSEPFTIDRTEWGIKYKSGKFEALAKDKLIDDNIELSVDVKATKA